MMKYLSNKKNVFLVLATLLSLLFVFLLESISFSSILKDKNIMLFGQLEKKYGDSNTNVIIQRFSTNMDEYNYEKWDNDTELFDVRFGSPVYATIFKTASNIDVSVGDSIISSEITISDITYHKDKNYNFGKIKLEYSRKTDFSALYDGNSIYISFEMANLLIKEFGLSAENYNGVLGKTIKISQEDYSDFYCVEGIYNDTLKYNKSLLNSVYQKSFGMTCFVSRQQISCFSNTSGFITCGLNYYKNMSIHDYLDSHFNCNFSLLDSEVNDAFQINNKNITDYYNNFVSKEQNTFELFIPFFVLFLMFFIICFVLTKKTVASLASFFKVTSMKKVVKTATIFISTAVTLSLLFFAFVYFVFSRIIQLWFVFKNPMSLLFYFVVIVLYVVFVLVMFWYHKELLSIRQNIKNNYQLPRTIINEDPCINDEWHNLSFLKKDNKPNKKALVFSRGADFSTAGGQRTICDATMLSRCGFKTFVCGITSYEDGFNLSDTISFIKWEVSLNTKNKFKKLLEFSKIKHIKKGFEIAGDVDVVLINSVLAINQLIYIKRYCKSKNIQLIFDVVEFQNLSEQSFSSFVNYYLPNVVMNSLIIKKDDNVIAISTFLEQYFNKKKCNTIRIPFVNLHFDNSTFKSSLLKNRIVFLYAGSPGKKDNLYGIISAFSSLDDETKQRVALVIAGPDEKIFTKIGVSSSLLSKCSNVVFPVGKLTFDDLISVYRSSDFSVLLKNNLKRHAKADYPSKVSQSLSFSLPVVANNSSDLSLFIKNDYNGFLIDENNPEMLAKAISNICKLSKEQIAEMKKNAFESAKKELSIDSFVSIFIKLL